MATSRTTPPPPAIDSKAAAAATMPVIGSASASPQNTGCSSSSQTTSPPATAASSPKAAHSRCPSPRPYPVTLIQTFPGAPSTLPGPHPSCSKARRARRLDHDVGLVKQRVQRSSPIRRGEIKSHDLLVVWVQRPVEGGHGSGAVGSRRTLDLHRESTAARQEHGGEGPGPHRRQVDDTEIGDVAARAGGPARACRPRQRRAGLGVFRAAPPVRRGAGLVLRGWRRRCAGGRWRELATGRARRGPRRWRRRQLGPVGAEG